MVGAAAIAGTTYVSRQIGWPDGVRVLYSGMAVVCVFLWSWGRQVEQHGRRYHMRQPTPASTDFTARWTAELAEGAGDFVTASTTVATNPVNVQRTLNLSKQ